MKAFIALVSVLLIVIIGGVTFMLMSGSVSGNFYDTTTKIKSNQVKEDNDGLNMYYYYQEECVHCQELKPYMKKVEEYNKENDDFDLYFIDVAESSNDSAWSTDPAFGDMQAAGRIDAVNKMDIYTITGTPTLIVEDNGTVVGYYVGTADITTFFGSNYKITK